MVGEEEMTEAGASSWAKQVVGAGSVISRSSYGSRVCFLPIIMWKKGPVSPCYMGDTNCQRNVFPDKYLGMVL